MFILKFRSSVYSIRSQEPLCQLRSLIQIQITKYEFSGTAMELCFFRLSLNSAPLQVDHFHSYQTMRHRYPVRLFIYLFFSLTSDVFSAFLTSVFLCNHTKRHVFSYSSTCCVYHFLCLAVYCQTVFETFSLNGSHTSGTLM